MKTAVGIISIQIILIVGFGIGWILNIIDFVKLDFKEPYKAEIIRGIGIPAAPIGGILGYLTIEDGQPKVTDTISSTK